MNLAAVVSFFARDRIDGWDTTNSKWVDGIACGDLEAFEDVVRSGEGFMRTRLLSMAGDGKDLAGYAVLRIGGETGPVFLKGHGTVDVEFADRTYQTTFQLRLSTAKLMRAAVVRTNSASGVPGTSVFQNDKEYYADVTHRGSENDRIMQGIAASQATIYLPADCPAALDDKLSQGADTYRIREVSPQSGLLVALCSRT